MCLFRGEHVQLYISGAPPNQIWDIVHLGDALGCVPDEVFQTTKDGITAFCIQYTFVLCFTLFVC